MYTAKKITPTEFRLSQKSFIVDYSPNNYFEKFHIEIIIQNIVNWFFWKYGLYLYIQKVNLRENKIILQLYFYPTYLQERFMGKYYESLEEISTMQNRVKSRDESVLDYSLLKQVDDRVIEQANSLQNAVVNIRNKRLFRQYYLARRKNISFDIKKFSYLVAQEEVKNSKKEHHLVISSYKAQKLITLIALDFYFTYYFQYSFKLEANVLYKNLVKQFFSNKTLKNEHKQILFSTKYLQKFEWSYDLFFFTHFALVYSNPGFLLNMFYKAMAQAAAQKRFFYNFGDILKKFAILKRGTVRGIKLILNGVYDRHGRTRIWVWHVGKISVTSERSLIHYDWLTFETRYGSFSLKMWVSYNKVVATPYLLELDR